MVRGVLQSLSALFLLTGCAEECPDFAQPPLLDLKVSDLALPAKELKPPPKDAGADAAQAEILGEPLSPPLDCTMGPPRDAHLPPGFRNSEPGKIKVSYELDLDHDGRKDRFVTAEHLCNVASQCAYAIYALRGKCGLFLGTAMGYPGGFIQMPMTDHGFSELEVVQTCVETTAGGWKEVRYRFNGHMYVVSEQRTCRNAAFPDPGDHARRCGPWEDLGGVSWHLGQGSGCKWWPPGLDFYSDPDGGPSP